VTDGRGTDGRGTDGRDDRALLAAHVAGDPEAFTILVRRHRDRLWAVAMRTLRDREEAADLAQEIFLRLYRKLDRFDSARPFDPWFWRLAARVSADSLEKRAAAAREIPLEQAPAATTEDEGPALAQETTVGRALARLPRSYRLPLLLHYELGLPLQEVAEVTRLTVPAVKSRLHRARLELQRELCRA
jgi:RNA polymerase sigma-70 factor (ECF subfamily)